MSGRRGSGAEGGDPSEAAIEIIDLEPGDEVAARREQSVDRPGRRRGPVVLALIVLVALAAVTITSWTRASSPRRASSTTDARHTNIDLTGNPATGPVFPFRVGAQILAGGANGLRVVDTDTGRTTAPNVAGLPPGPVTIVAHSGSTVAVRTHAHLYWFSLPEGDAHRLDADTAFAAVAPGSLWLAGSRSATEVPGDHDRLPRNRIATSGPAFGATRAGLLVHTKAGILLQPTTGTGGARLLLRAPATVIGVAPDRVAWVRSCGVLSCPVHVTEIVSGATSSWVQLSGHPSPQALADSSAVFSPDGASLAVVVPNDNLTATRSFLVADLRARTTTALGVAGFATPARPGSQDANGTTVDWTPDGGSLVVASASVTGGHRLAVVNAQDPNGVAGRVALDDGASLAAVGVSAAGALDLARRSDLGPIATNTQPLLRPGLHLVGADADQVDVLDLSNEQTHTWPFGGETPNPAGTNAIARITGGWLVVRDGIVDRLTDDGSRTGSGAVDAGSLVFSANGGRDAWIAIANGGAHFTAEHYDAATGTVGQIFSLTGQPVGAVSAGLVVVAPSGIASTEIEVVDSSGRSQQVTVDDSASFHVLATGGDTIAYTGTGTGLDLVDVATRTSRLIAYGRLVEAAALSPDGTQLAWIETGTSGATDNQVDATRIGSGKISGLGGPADRVLVADDGFVLFTSGATVWRGEVGVTGGILVDGLAPDPAAALALG